MEDVHSAGRVPYVAASPPRDLSLSEQLQFYISVFYDIILVVVLSIPILIKGFMELFVPTVKKSVAEQTVVITGGGNGIGRAIAFRLAQEHCNIAIVDIDGDAAEKTAAQLVQEFSIQAIGYKVDVTDNESLLKLKKQINNDFGLVDILINNAGLMPLLSLREGPIKDVNRIAEVNINANFWTIRTFIDDMIKQKRGHIVGITSMSALHPMGGAVIYTATKFAIVGFMQALEQELRQEGFGGKIHFTCVHPYFVSTRKDLMDAVHLRFPAITPEMTAEATVNGILRNKRTIVIPKIDGFLAKFVRNIPYGVECLIRDYVLKEKESRMFKISMK